VLVAFSLLLLVIGAVVAVMHRHEDIGPTTLILPLVVGITVLVQHGQLPIWTIIIAVGMIAILAVGAIRE